MSEHSDWLFPRQTRGFTEIILDPVRLNPYSSAPLQCIARQQNGEVSEWLKEHAWKVCIRESVSRVRTPLSPPYSIKKAPNENSGLFYSQNLTWGMILGVTLLRQAENR